MSGLRKFAAKRLVPLLWVGLNLKIGIIPALVDSGVKYSSVRSDVIVYLYHRSERRTLLLVLCHVCHLKVVRPRLLMQ